MATQGIKEIQVESTKYLIEPTLFTTIKDTSTASAYVADLTNFQLFNGVQVSVKFNQLNNNANATLNINGTGAKKIYYAGGGLPAGMFHDYHTYNFIYDSSLDSSNGGWRLVGSDRLVRQGTTNTDQWRKILLAYNTGASSTVDVTESTGFSYQAKDISVQPSTGTLYAKLLSTTGLSSSGNITVDSILTLTASGNSGYYINKTVNDVSRQISLHIGGTSGDMGIYDDGNSKWLIKIDTNNKVYVNGVEFPTTAKLTDTWNALSTSQAGYVAQAPNDTTKFLRGDATWAKLPVASTDTAGIIQIGTGATNAAAGNHNHNSVYLTAVGYDTTNKKFYYTKNGSNTDIVTAATLFTSPALTGTPTAPTADNGTNTTQIATTAFVNNTLSYINAMQFKGTLGTGGTITALPATHNAGDTYRVITADTWAGKYCEVGTLIICVKDGTVAADADWTSVETNEDGTIIGSTPSSSTDNAIVRWDGSTGRVIQNSLVTISDTGTITAGNLTIGGTVDTGAGKTISSNSTLWLNRGASTSLIFCQNSGEKARFDTSNNFIPGTTNSYNIGASDLRWKTVYATTLDGNLAWSNLTDVPSTFTPGSHNHNASDINDGILGTARGGTGNNTYTGNRLVWTENSTKIKDGYHYADSTHVGICSTSQPSTNFYVGGSSNLNGNTTIGGTTTTISSSTIKFTGLGEGLEFVQDGNYFGSNYDARIINIVDINPNASSSAVDGGLIIRAVGRVSGTDTIQELLRIRNHNGSADWKTGEFQWKTNDIVVETGTTKSWNISIGGNAATATKIAITTAAPTSSKIVGYISFSTAITGNNDLYAQDSLYLYDTVTSSAISATYLNVGKGGTIRGGLTLHSATNNYHGDLVPATLGANRTWTLPNATGTIALTSSNVASADSAKWLMNRGTNVTVADSTWSHGIVGAGGTNTTGGTVWKQKWTQSGLTWNNSGTSTTLSDSGDMVIWLSQSNNSNNLWANLAIDGYIYSLSGFRGGGASNISINSATANSAIMTVKNTATGVNGDFYWGYSHLMPNLATGGNLTGLTVGTAASDNNSAYFGWHHEGSSSANNYISIGTYGHNHLIKVYKTGNTVIAGTTTSTKFIGPLEGNADTATSTPLVKKYITANDTSALVQLRATNVNGYIFQAGHATAADGTFSNNYILEYHGEGTSPNNYLILKTSNGSASVDAVKADELGNITFANTILGTIKHTTAAHYGVKTARSTGVIKAKIKIKDAWMLAFTFRLYQNYDYDDYLISGYNYNTSKWYSPKVTVQSTKTGKHTVSFGYDDDAQNNYCTLWVSVPAHNYTGADIFNVTNGYTQIDIANAFEIVYESESTGTVQTTVDCYRPWLRDETVTNATNASNITQSSSTADLARPIWFCYQESNSYILGKPGYNTNFMYNPGTKTITIGSGSLSETEYSGNASSATAANITTTANAVAYYSDTAGTFASKASANGALYATSANGALSWGTLPIAQGGTGQTTAEAAANTLLTGLSTWSATPTDTTYFIRRSTDGSAAFGQAQFSTLWSYIDGKASSTGFTGTPKSVTPTSSSDAKMIATKEYVDGIVAANDALVYKGTKAGASAATNGGTLLPAGVQGDTYKVSTAGYINGMYCEVGDMIICVTDVVESTTSNYNTTKDSWNVIQTSDGTVSTSETSVTEGQIPTFKGTTGKFIQNSSKSFSTATPSSSSTDTQIPTSKAVWAAINALDVSDISGFGAGKTLSALSQTDGKISASFQSIILNNLRAGADNRNVATTPNDYNITHGQIIFQGLKVNSTIGSPSDNNYAYLLGLRGWGDSSGGNAHEFAFYNTGIAWRYGATTTWSSWKHLAMQEDVTAEITASKIEIIRIPA